MSGSTVLHFLRRGAFFALCVTSCAGSGNYIEAATYVPDAQAKAARTPVIRHGDMISIQVFGEVPLSLPSAKVGKRGTVTLPLLGEQPVTGKEPAALASELEKALAAYVNTPHVTVTIDQSPVIITVIGEITSSRLQMEWPVRIVDALAQAGGINDFADKSGIFVLRGGQRIRFEYEDIIRNEAHARDFLMVSGDVLVVE